MLTIQLEGKAGKISGHWNHTLLDVIRNMPGFKRWKDYVVSFEMTGANLEYLTSALPEAIWTPEAKAERDRMIVLRRQEEETRNAKLNELPAEAFKFPFKTKPMDHQARAFMLSREQKAFGYFMEMGTGKSKVIIDNAAFLFSRSEVDLLLVTAPNGVHRQWVDEQLPAHMPEWTGYKAAFYESGMSKKRMAELEAVMAFRNGLAVVTMNIEALSHKSGEAFLKRVLQRGRVLWAVDESTRISKPSSQRTKACLRLAPLAAYRRIASGAPVTKGVEDLYTQLMFLDPDILGFSSFYTFRNRYCVMGGWEAKQIVSYRNVDELQRRLDGWTYRITKADCLDLPEKVYVTRTVLLSEEQKKHYENLKTEFITWIEGGEVDANLAITRLMRLQQVVCGFLPTENGVIQIDKQNPRIEALMEILEQAQGKVIVWARFKEDVRMIREALNKKKIAHVTYTGADSSEERAAAKERFMTDPDCSVWVGNAAAGGIGLNLVVANTMVYYSNEFNADVRWQSEDRIHRIGQKNTATYIDLVAEKTVDVKILKALKNKKSVADSVIDKNDLLLDI